MIEIRQPVKRDGADRYMILTLLSFGASVALTRLFLQLTGFPQLGNDELHIAHVLWGGVLLFAASLLPLILANRWVYRAGSILAGVGVGLFIDEVGKFITQNNDYFHPAAAPIIYAFFLLTVLVYTRVRRPPQRSARAELYRAFEKFEELLDHDLDKVERAELEDQLRYAVENAEHPDVAYLAEELLSVVAKDDLHLAPDLPDFWDRLLRRLRAFEERWVDRFRLRAVLTGGIAGLGALDLLDITRLLLALGDPALLERLIADLVTLGRVTSASGLTWYYARLALEGSVGIVLVVASIHLALGREARGFALGGLGLLLSLTTVNLLVFYFDQFVTILTATVQLLLLLGVGYYRQRYLSPG